MEYDYFFMKTTRILVLEAILFKADWATKVGTLPKKFTFSKESKQRPHTRVFLYTFSPVAEI